MLAGVVVSTRLGIQATIFYLAGYLLMNMAAFAVITARERETEVGDDISSLYGLGADRPGLAWPMTIAMLSLAGFPATVGFFGKLYLIQAAVDNEYAWLGVAIVIGSAISLVYYLRVIAAVWMRPGLRRRGRGRRAAGGRPRPGDRRRLARGRRRGRRRRAERRGGDGRRRRPAAPRRAADAVAPSLARRDRARDPRPRSTRPRRSPRSPSSARRVCALATRARSAIWPEPLVRPRPRRGRGDRLARSRRVRRPRGAPRPAAAERAPGASFRARAPTGRGASPSHPHPAAGQGSLEYVGLLALVATAFAVAAPAAGLAGVPAQVAGSCAPACASSAGTCAARRTPRRRGCAPCTLSDERRGGGLAVTVLSVRVGGEHQWLVARRSDGSVAVTKVARDDVGASGGLGYELGPLKAGVEGEAGLRVAVRRRLGVPRRGERAALPRRGALRAVGRDRPLARRVALRRGGAGDLGLGGARRRRHRRGRHGASRVPRRASRSRRSPRSARGSPAAPRRSTCARRPRARARPACSTGARRRAPRGPVVAEYTRDASGPRELAFRVSARGAARAPGGRDGRAAGPARPGQPRGRRAAAAPPRAVAAVGRRGPARGGPPRRPLRHGGAQRLRGRRTTRARSSWPPALGAEVGVEAGYAKVDRRLAGGQRLDGRLARTRPRGLHRVTDLPAERISCAPTQSVAL